MFPRPIPAKTHPGSAQATEDRWRWPVDKRLSMKKERFAMFTPGTHTMRVTDAAGSVLAEGSYTVE